MSRVTLRKKDISGGRVNLYLDIYPPVRHLDRGELTRKQYLKIYLYAKPRTELERFHNKETMELAMNVAAKTQIDVQNLKFGFMSTRMLKENFVEYMEAQLAKHRNLSNRANWINAIKYFKDFAGKWSYFLK